VTFKQTRATLFQQRWKSKSLVRGYHGDHINEQVFKRWYLPITLPDVRPKQMVWGDDKNHLEVFALRRKAHEEKEAKRLREEEEKGMAPVGSLMFSEVERRIDVFIFRCCFAHSVYEARRLVIHGNVLLNGKRHQNANTRLAPGDMVTVDPKAIRLLQPPTNGENASQSSFADKPPPLTQVLSELDSNGEPLTPFNLPDYASPFIFIPAYIEVSFQTCSAVYVRHPTARPGYSEIPTPYDADGEIVRLAWEWYVRVRPRLRSKRQLTRMPENRKSAEEISAGI